jgi:hypothetical protein
VTQSAGKPWWDQLLQADADTTWHAAALEADDLQARLGPDDHAWPARLEDGNWGLAVLHGGEEMTGTAEEIREWLARSG